MVTYIYICNRCKGPEERRTFEHNWRDIGTAAAGRTPACPKCGSARGVTRFFGHKIFGPASKSAERDHSEPPSHYVKLDQAQGKGVLSIGLRMDSEPARQLKEKIDKFVEEKTGTAPTPLEPVESENAPASEDSGVDQHDPVEEVLGLKPGTTDRALFDIRQKKVVQDLKNGAPISGFFMPVSENNNN